MDFNSFGSHACDALSVILFYELDATWFSSVVLPLPFCIFRFQEGLEFRNRVCCLGQRGDCSGEGLISVPELVKCFARLNC